MQRRSPGFSVLAVMKHRAKIKKYPHCIQIHRNTDMYLVATEFHQHKDVHAVQRSYRSIRH